MVMGCGGCGDLVDLELMLKHRISSDQLALLVLGPALFPVK